MVWNPVIAARNLAGRVGSGIWPETRAKLESLAECGNPAAEAVAKGALKKQAGYDNESEDAYGARIYWEEGAVTCDDTDPTPSED